MPVVSNTSPILNLAIVGQLDLMRQQFGQIQIPPAVLDELTAYTRQRSGRTRSAGKVNEVICRRWLLPLCRKFSVGAVT